MLRARLQMFFVCNITLVRMNTFTNNNLILIVCKSPLTMYFANEYRFMTVNLSLRSFTIVLECLKEEDVFIFSDAKNCKINLSVDQIMLIVL